MSINDFKPNPDDITSIDGIDISEGCSPSNMNDAIRHVMSDLHDLVNKTDVTQSASGWMSSIDKIKLDGIEKATQLPKANGVATIGISTKYATEDHIHPEQTTVTGNAGTATKLATARTIDGLSFDGSANRSHFAVCSTAAATAAKTATITGFTLETGAYANIQFTYTNTAASPTLNINKTGAKPIYYRNAVLPTSYIVANRIYIFIYDGNQYEMLNGVDENTKVTQTVTTTDATYPILASATANRTTTATEAARFAANIKINPKDESIVAKKIESNLVSTTYLAGNQGDAVVNSKSTAGGYTALIRYPSTNGVFCLSGYQAKLQVLYTTNATIEAGTNSTTKQVTLLDESGNATFPGTVTATAFSGPASKLGTATVGSTSKPIYLNAGTATALSATVGAVNTPIYSNAGTLTACSSTVGGPDQPT